MIDQDLAILALRGLRSVWVGVICEHCPHVAANSTSFAVRWRRRLIRDFCYGGIDFNDAGRYGDGHVNSKIIRKFFAYQNIKNLFQLV